MRRPRPARRRLAGLLTTAAACLLLLAACEDPSGVGLTVIDPGESDPRARTIPAGEVALVPLPDPSGAFLTSTGFQDFNGLAGFADDPLFGTTRAYAYLDMLAPQNFPEGFRDRPVREARLRLVKDYAYGDTSAVTTLDVRQIAEDWTAVGAIADTTFPVMDGIITSFEVAPGDSLVELALPEDWVLANDTMLRAADFSNLFHGFRLSTESTSGAVYGFNGRSALELISEEDTVRYPVSEIFSHIEATPAPAFPEGLIPLRDGSGTGVNLTFVLDTLGTPALNTAFLRVTADTAAAQADLPAGFVRPLARELALFGTFEDQDPLILGQATLDPATQTYSFRSNTITSVLQSMILGREPVDGFAVGVPPTRSSLDVAPLVAPPAEGAPRAVLILIPTQD